jgi:hypothetical protein
VTPPGIFFNIKRSFIILNLNCTWLSKHWFTLWDQWERQKGSLTESIPRPSD